MTQSQDSLIEKLICRLSDPDATERRNAVGALRLHGRRAICAVPHLIRLLDDEDSAVRAEAERALNRIGQSAA